MKKLITLTSLILSIITMSFSQETKLKIIYVYDPLCGWCYGFSPVMVEVYEKYKDRIDFEVVSGGMVTGDRVGPIGEIAGYIKQAYKTVEDRTGIKFGEAFLTDVLEEGSPIFSSTEPSIAMSVFKTYQPEKALLFAHALQKAIYKDGIHPTSLEDYRPYVEQFGINPEAFIQKIKEEKAVEATNQDFQRTADFGVNGFPTVFIEKEGEYYVLTRGYTDLEIMMKRVKAFLE